ncbi:MAG TPA: hypothetical protein VFJ58_12365 [Armatimonadota bacterium]|nr:hypothetical protein [Armatimonadota bacterium]
MSLDWRTAYLRQAQSDYDIYLQLLTAGAPRCHQLHYLQMATEKLGKSYLCPASGDPPARIHDAFVKFVKVSRARDDLRRIGAFARRAQYEAFINSLLSKAKEVEDLSPEGPDHPNPEYPWKAGGIVFSPLEYVFPTLDPKRDPRMLKLLQFVENCFRLASL